MNKPEKTPENKNIFNAITQEQAKESSAPYENKWLHISDLNFNENIKQLNLDTRDFHGVIVSEEKPIKIKVDWDIAIKYPNRFLYTIEEVKQFLTKAELDSGGRKEWRFLSYDDYPETHSWEIKYLLVAKIPENKQSAKSDKSANYVILSRDNWVSDDKHNKTYICKLMKRAMWDSTVNKEHLNDH